MLLIIYLTLIGVTAFLISLVGIWVVSAVSKSDRTRRWVLFLLVAGILLALPLTAVASRFRTGAEGLILILEIPALIGILTLLFINWRVVYDRWQEERILVSALLLTLLMLLVLMAWGDPTALPLILILPAVVLAGVWFAGQRLRLGILLSLSLGVLALLILDAVGLTVTHVVLETSWLWMTYKVASILGVILALSLAALLVNRSLEAWRIGDRRRSYAQLTLAASLVMGLVAATLRHGLLTKATARAAEDHMPIGVVAVAVMVGLLLTFGPRERHTRAGLAFTLLVPALIAVAFTSGWLFNPQAIAAARGEQINRVVQRYYQNRGEYPDRLTDLTPGYMPFILGPLTGRGQVWCYQGGKDFYRLGYVIFQRYYGPTFPEPYYEIKMLGAAGHPPATSWMCDLELELMKDTGGL